MDIYEFTNMMTAVEILKPARRFLLDTFFQNVDVSAAESITFDITKGRRTIAPYVSPMVAGKVMQKQGYKTLNFVPAYVKPKTVSTAGDFLKRSAGEVFYGGGKTPEMRAAEQLAKEVQICDDSITRRLEQMCSEAIQTGKIVIKGDGIEAEIDFGMDQDNLATLTGGDKWSAPTTAHPLDDFRELKRQGLNRSGVGATDAILGSNAYADFMKCDDVIGSSTKKSLFDLTNVQLGRINPQELPDGVTYIGRLTEPALDLWTYDEWYIDENTNEEKPMIDPDSVILGSRNGQGTQCYGAIKDVDAIEAGLFAVPRYPKVWTEKDPSARYFMLQSAPLIVPKVIDSWICVKVR